MTYKITLATGVVFDNLTRNGDAYMSAVEPDESVFTEEAMKSVTIQEIPGPGETVNPEEATTVYTDLVFRSIFYHTQEQKWGINFHQLTADEKKELNVADNIVSLDEAVAELYETGAENKADTDESIGALDEAVAELYEAETADISTVEEAIAELYELVTNQT